MGSASTFQEIKDVLGRLFMGRASVRGGAFDRAREVTVGSFGRSVSVGALPARSSEGLVSSLDSAGTVVCCTSSMTALLREGCLVRGGIQKMEGIPSRGAIFHVEIKVRKGLPRRTQLQLVSALDRIGGMPQKRQNLLKHLRNRLPEGMQTGIIACYSPLVKSSVRKTSLDKKGGALNIWMDSHKLGMSAYHLLLMMDAGEVSKLRWIWMEAGKKGQIFRGNLR